MRISVPREIKPEEARVGLTPTMVTSLTAQGHEVFVEEGAGLGAGFSDDDYREAGAQLTSQEEAWAQAELLVKVKEPIPAEYGFLRALAALGQAAAQIGESDEAARIEKFLNDSDPEAAAQIQAR